MNTAIQQIANRHFGAKVVRALAQKGITLTGLQAAPGFPGDTYLTGASYVINNNDETQVRSYFEVLALANSDESPTATTEQ